MKPKLWIIGLLLLKAATTGLAAPPSKPVAVLDFTVPVTESNRWAWAEGGLADLLQIELQKEGLLLVDRDLIHAVLNEQRMAANSTIAEKQLTLARLLNAQYLVAGKVLSATGNRIRIEASVFSVEAIETVVTESSEGAFPKDLSLALENIAKQISKQLQTRGVAVESTGQTSTSPKPESLIMFYRGLNACARGQPELGVGYFMNAASLDDTFTVPLLWEIKAYEMAGFASHAAIRREETADVLRRLGVEWAGQTNNLGRSDKPVLAVLNPVGTAGDGTLATSGLGAELTRALLATSRVRVFAFEGIGAAIAEQDLRLSSFFASQYAPRYGRWLAADGLVLCRFSTVETNRIALELSLVNPLNATVLTRVHRTGTANALPALVQAAAEDLLATWTNRSLAAASASLTPEPSVTQADNGNTDLRPAYVGLATALARVRREPGKSDAHRALAEAFIEMGRTRLAAFEIEQCLEHLDINAPKADQTYLSTYLWLVSGIRTGRLQPQDQNSAIPMTLGLFLRSFTSKRAMDLVNKNLLNQRMQQLLTTHPQSLAAGCLHYNLAVSDWRDENWASAADHAVHARQVIKPPQKKKPELEREIKRPQTGPDIERETIAATYFLEGACLGKLGKITEARSVFIQGLDYMNEFNIRNSFMAYGLSMGELSGVERITGGGGGQPLGVRTRIEKELALLDGKPDREMGLELPRSAANKVPEVKSPLRIDEKQFRRDQQLSKMLDAVSAGDRSVLKGILSSALNLRTALAEVALARDPAHVRDEMARCRQAYGLPAVEAGWIEWFNLGRKYANSRWFDIYKATAAYRNAIEFLEDPERGGFYHLEKHPGDDHVALRWGSSIGEEDFAWSQDYDSRWQSSAFYLAQCLIEVDQKEEAAQWLRRIALKAGGDNVLLIEQVTTNGSASYHVCQLGVRAAELLNDLHRDSVPPRFGEAAGPYKLPAIGHKARLVEPPPLPALNPEILRDLKNTLAEVARESGPGFPNPKLQAFAQRYGHEGVPALLSLLPRAGELLDEASLAWMLEQTATDADAKWIVPACRQHLKLIALAWRLDPHTTAETLAEEWRAQTWPGSVPYVFIMEIVRARVRPLYALVLGQVAETRANHALIICLMDTAVREEKSDELEEAFREALARCLRSRLRQGYPTELSRISQVALQHGVPEGIEGLLTCMGSSPEELRKVLSPVVDLPESNDATMALLRSTGSHWEWDPTQKKFRLR